MGGADTRIMQGKIKDPRYPENLWKKMQHVHKHPELLDGPGTRSSGGDEDRRPLLGEFGDGTPRRFRIQANSGIAGGGNIGVAAGVTLLQRENEGRGYGIDFNLGAVSPAFYFEMKGLTGWAWRSAKVSVFQYP